MTGKKTKHLVKRASPGLGEFVAITVVAKSDDAGLDDCGLMGGVMKWTSTLFLSFAHGFPQSFLVVKVKHFELVALSELVQMLNWRKQDLVPNSVRIRRLQKSTCEFLSNPIFFGFGKIPNLKHFPTERTVSMGIWFTNVPYQDFIKSSWGSQILGCELPVRLQDLEELTLKMRKKCQAHEELQRCSSWWFQIFFIFTLLPGEMIQFDKYFSVGLKPPTSVVLGIFAWWWTGEERKQFLSIFREIHLEDHWRISIRNVVLIINSIVVCLYNKQPPDTSPVIFSLRALIHFDATWITRNVTIFLAFDAPSLDSGEEKMQK